MSLHELFQRASVAWPLWLGIAVLSPIVLWLWGRKQPPGHEARVFGHVASGLVALGLLTIVVATLALAYLNSQGVNLVTDVSAMALLAPYIFGVGNLFAATRSVSFSRLRTYPLLRRVWAVLSIGALITVAWMVLRHTYWLVFSGILGVAIVALIAWTLLRKLTKRATEPPPAGGDPDLFDEVAAGSRERIEKLLRSMDPPKR